MKIIITAFSFLVCIVFSPIFDKNKQYTLLKTDCSPESSTYITFKEYNSTTSKPNYPKKRPKYIKVD